jgi:arabinose-5-phosphate isomerase
MSLDYAREVLLTEAEAIRKVAGLIGESFLKALDMIIGCKGRVVLTGMGKAGIIAQKISATLASTGTPSLFIHPAEARHGDLGRKNHRHYSARRKSARRQLRRACGSRRY